MIMGFAELRRGHPAQKHGYRHHRPHRPLDCPGRTVHYGEVATPCTTQLLTGWR
jgi:hypothetical protein